MAKEYIERDALKRVYMLKGKDRLRLSTVINELEILPAADVAPVVHGGWKTEWDAEKDPKKYFIRIVCSNCGLKTGGIANYCPNCGAKMDKASK